MMGQPTFPLAPLGSVLKRADRFERREDYREYRFAGVYSFSKGLFFREPIAGTTFKLPQIQRLREGDFIYSKIMAWEGAFALAPAEAHDTVLSGAFLVYEIDQTQVLPEYLKFYFQNGKVWKTIGAKSSGTNVRRQSLGPEIFEKELFPLPTLDEQQIIVTRLLEASAIQAQIKHKQQESATLLTRLRQTILREAVQGRLLPQDPTEEPAPVLLARIRAEKQCLIKKKQLRAEKPLPPLSESEVPYELPTGWAWCRLGEVIRIESNLVAPTSYSTLPHIAPNNIEKHTGRLLEYVSVKEDEVTSPNHLFKPGQILYSKIRPSLNKATIIDFEGLCSADMYPIKAEINTEYLLRFILSEVFLQQVYQIENRVKMPKLNQNELTQFVISIPPLAEQRRIVAKVAELLAHCTELEAELSRARAAAIALQAAALREAFMEPAVSAAKAAL